MILFLVALPAIVTFGAGQATPALSGLIVGLVGVPFLIAFTSFRTTSGDTRGCLTALATIFGLLTLGCGSGAAASLVFDNWKA